MIKLTSLLLEDEQRVYKALFIGDVQTVSPISFAKKVSRSRYLDVDIEGRVNSTVSDLNNILQTNIISEYDVVTIFPGLIKNVKNEDIIIQTLTSMFSYVKESGCILVAITNTTANFVDKSELYEFNESVSEWIQDQDIADVVIDTTEFSNLDFIRRGTILDEDAQNTIAQRWMRNVLPLLQSAADLDVIDTDDKMDVNVEQIKELQVKLLSLGYLQNSNDVTGKMDSATILALSQFQQDQDIKPSGTIDAITTNKLDTVADTGDSKLTNLVPKKSKRSSTASHNDIATANTIIDFFVDKGLSETGAAGIAGNLFVESRFKTDNPGDGGTSNGLAQWHNDRWWGPNGFEAWCTSKGLDPWSVNGQLEFLWWDLSTNYSSLSGKLKDEDITPEEAAYIFADKYERPAHISSERKEKAAEFYEEYSKSSLNPLNVLQSLNPLNGVN